MQIELIEDRTYTARRGAQSIAGLRITGEWEGLRKLQNDAGATLIVDGNTVLKASPSLFGELLATASDDCFVTVPETRLVDGSVVPAFQVAQYLAGKDAHGKLVINAEATPWTNISYRQARAVCAAAGYQLITERQWLAIAWTVANLDTNWTGGKVGQGELLQGIRNGHVSAALPGKVLAQDETECRRLLLTSGDPLIDFNGNAFSWVYDDVQGDAEGLVKDRIAADSLSLQAPYPSLEKGMGWRPRGECQGSGNALIRGGFWYSESLAGVFSLGGGWPGNAVVYVGFRRTKGL